ncbi:MAG: TAXI family TRAP transporter solute-binding subunit [Okeania sp. SIO3B5]|uniref:TAXI family TRAP transporter solute-binding subunit n=1 Tax=Okeania sp. SIO3B5 TaxID=2607811 RepID=UPI0013FF96D3|nr:TAXI family TRAP transporter solute-binding subunit [Okeania sp. SIO3B5]NEO55678.1 TAXI family TRAP transporter solute-binding subunit [Okeania sp. SIO3B5]
MHIFTKLSTAIYPHHKLPSKLIGVGGIFLWAIALTSCTTQRHSLTLSTGANGGAYENIGRQIVISAREVGKITVHDNYDSYGSQQNLKRLLNGETDLALVQVDVASEAMKMGKVQTIAVLAHEYLHLITQSDSEIETFTDLDGKRVIFGTPESGIYFTARRLFSATNLNIIEANIDIREGFDKLKQKEIDAFIYVGPVGSSKKVQAELATPPLLRLVPISTAFINYLTIQFPESYQSATMPKGSYIPLPPIPQEDLPTISTAAALVTRPDVSKEKIALLTWSIISSSRQYSLFYPELADGNARSLLQSGLVYLHPGSQQAFEQGDPRQVWMRYLEENQDLQAGMIIVISTGILGFLLRMWRHKQCLNMIKNSRLALSNISLNLEENPIQALKEVEELRQQHRSMLIEGDLPKEAFEKLEEMTKVLVEECRILQEKQNQKDIQNTIALIDEWQSMSEVCPEEVKDKLENLENKYREMLLSRQIDIQTFIHLTQLISHYVNLNNNNSGNGNGNNTTHHNVPASLNS